MICTANVNHATRYRVQAQRYPDATCLDQLDCLDRAVYCSEVWESQGLRLDPGLGDLDAVVYRGCGLQLVQVVPGAGFPSSVCGAHAGPRCSRGVNLKYMLVIRKL